MLSYYPRLPQNGVSMPGYFLTIGRILLASCLVSSVSHAATLSFDNTQVVNSSTATGDVREFSFVIEIRAMLRSGVQYTNPEIATIDYTVAGQLDSGNPSQFPAFRLNRPEHSGSASELTGTDFYATGGTVQFEIASTADLSNGLQVDELALLNDQGFPAPVDQGDAVFILDAREVGTGRYHPPVLILRADGTGQILNSNNTGDNPQDVHGSQLIEGPSIGLDYGLEYITTFAFNPATLSLIPDPIGAEIPLPAGLVLLGSALAIALASAHKRSCRVMAS